MPPKILVNESEIPSGVRIINAYNSAVEELFFIENPKFKKSSPGAPEALAEFLNTHNVPPIWVYYSKENTVVKTVPEEIYFKLRTSRNRNIITHDEQENYRAIKVGVAGLSVGSAVIAALVQSGGPKRMKIADFDVLEVTNLNRIRGTLLDVGSNKTELAAKSVWHLDPFAELELFESGITKDNLEKFLGDPKIDIFIDEMDSIDLKILSRFYCQANGIPVLMATDNGDGVILDVERFDLEKNRPIFHGLVDIKPEEVSGGIDFKMWLKLATQIVGPEFLTESMQQSLTEIGKTLPAVPQLGPSATIAGSSIAYAVRRIANGYELPSGRYCLGLEEKLIRGYNDESSVSHRKLKTEEFIKSFGK